MPRIHFGLCRLKLNDIPAAMRLFEEAAKGEKREESQAAAIQPGGTVPPRFTTQVTQKRGRAVGEGIQGCEAPGRATTISI